jgi:replication factor A1
LTLWGKQAEQFTAEDHPVIAFKGVKVGDFGGRSLSMFSSSTMSINPDIEESFALRGWYDAIGSEQAFQSHSSAISSMGLSGGFNRAEARNLNDVKESQLGMSDKVDYFSAKATIMHIKSENISYPACPTQGCSKKVTQTNEGGWRCEKCDRTFEKPEHRYIISLAVADWSGQAWLQGFNDAGLAVFGMPANDIVEVKERDEAQYHVLMHKANCATFNFVCRAKQDTYNDQTRVRYGITRIMPLDYREEACALRDLLRSPWGQ